MKLNIELKSRQVPFHNIESKYYKLIKDNKKKEKIETYKKLKKSKKHFFTLIYFIKKSLKDDFNKKKYNQLYNRILTMIDFKNPIETLPLNEKCIYLQKIGCEWCVYNKYKY